MSDNNKPVELKINGFAEAPGGEYAAVRINGRGKITGDVVCSGHFTANGSGDVSGNLECEALHVNGSGHFFGNVKTGALSVCGLADVDGTATAQSITVSGTAEFKKDVKTQTLKVSGAVRIKDGLSAESFESTGTFEVGGLLNADSINVHLYWGKSHAKEIGGEVITVHRGGKALDVFRQLFSLNPGLEADTIEGSHIDLEHTRARIVRGGNVTLGSGCDIDLLEYSGVLRKTGSARVREERKV